MVTIEDHQHPQFFPTHFFPNTTPQLKQFFWQHLVEGNCSVHDALMHFLKGTIKTPVEQEVVDMIADTLECDWANFLVTEKIKTAV